MRILLGLKFYYNKNKKVKEEIVGSGISITSAKNLQKRFELYDDWEKANKILKQSNSVISDIKKRYIRQNISFIDIARDVVSQICEEDIADMVYDQNYLRFYENVQVNSREHFIEILGMKDNTKYSIARLGEVVDYTEIEMVRYMEGLSYVDLINFIKENYDEDFVV